MPDTPNPKDTQNFSAEQYFATQPKPSCLEDDKLMHDVRDFIARHKNNKRVVLVTVRRPG